MVTWRVAADARMQQVIVSGVAMAPAELAHSVHVEVQGLLPRRDYFYQFSTLYKTDPDLQAAHQKFPFVAIWDDHEVANDYPGLAPEFGAPSPEFTARRAAA
jgi:phosphodiesterase/alkaline phosphatase D-like protein